MAPERATAGKAKVEQEFFCFRLGPLRIGVPSENVREVVRVGPLTPLPRCPSFVLGVVGHRGEVLPLIDLLRFFGKGETQIGPRTRLFIAASGTYVAAVAADTVIGLQRISVDQILAAPMSGDAAAEHLLGIVNPERGDEALSLLNFSKLLVAARQRAVAR
ncbi:MAG: chemotaxis protein CheW [Myxococcaceae bacterium]